MRNKISLYLIVAIVAFGAGTFSSIQADSNAQKSADSELISKMNNKLDKILSNQEEMKSSIKKIVGRL